MAVSNPITATVETAAPRTAAGRRFVAAWCISVAFVALVIFPLATLFLINWFNEAGLRWIKEIRTRKFRMAEQIHSQDRILIAGGSSGLFGVDAELLEKRLRRPVVNLASHAGLGLRFLLEDARQAGRSGDTILLNIEYGLYASEPVLTDIERRYSWTYETSRLLQLPLTTLSQQLYGVPFADYVRSWDLWNRRFSGTLDKSDPPLWIEYPFVTLGPRGDYRGDIRLPAQIAEPHLEKAHDMTPTSRQLLEDFFSWAHRRGVHVIGTFPAVMRSSNGANTDRVFESIRSFYQEHHLTVLGDPHLVQMPRELFRDTPSHPTVAGRRLHTETLARLLAAQLQQPAPPEDQSVFLLLDPHSDLGLEDPSAAFRHCRYLTAEPLHHPYDITPAEVRELVQKGTPVYFDSPGVAEMLQPLGLQGVREHESTSTLADWIKSYPNHYFLLSVSGGARVPVLSAELPASFAKFLADDAPDRVAILGTGSFSRTHKTQSGIGFVRVKQSARPRWSHAAPVDYSASAWPKTEDHPDLRPLLVEKQPMADGTAEGDLAVCVVDPDLGIVVRRGTFHHEQHLDSELRRVTAQ